MPKFNIKRKEEIPAEVAVKSVDEQINEMNERTKEDRNEDAIQRAYENRIIETPVIATPEEKNQINEIIKEIVNENPIRTVFSMHNKDKNLRICIPPEIGLNEKDIIQFEKIDNRTIVMHRR